MIGVFTCFRHNSENHKSLTHGGAGLSTHHPDTSWCVWGSAAFVSSAPSFAGGRKIRRPSRRFPAWNRRVGIRCIRGTACRLQVSQLGPPPELQSLQLDAPLRPLHSHSSCVLRGDQAASEVSIKHLRVCLRFSTDNINKALQYEFVLSRCCSLNTKATI